MGLFTDTHDQVQPQGTYGFALNMLKDTDDGGMGVLASQNANTKIVDTNTIVGHITLDGFSVIIFTEPGNIYLFDGSTLELLQSYEDFAFSRNHPITGVMRTVNGCERVIYWCDGNNEDRYYNIDRPERFDSIDDFSFTPNVDYPTVTTTINDGGTLEYGTYRFVVEILDSNENVIIRTLPSQEVFIERGVNDGRPDSGKRIDVTISNLDEDFVSLRLGVLRFTSGDGLTPTAHYVGQPIVISNDTFTVRYTGFRPDAGESLIDYRELLNRVVTFMTSHTMTTAHSRLLRGNIIEQTYDYSLFQQYASKITTRYTVQTVAADERESLKTEHGDEVRDFGIVYLTNKGTITPRFHIPGRAKRAIDQVLTTGELIGENTLVEQWKVQNTSNDNDNSLGYFESTEQYTNPVNFCNDDYWGVDDEGNSLINTNVRYHRMPDRSQVPLYDGTNLNFIGIEFTNIEYPHPDIVGHFITDNVIDTNTKVDAGYIIPFNDEPNATGDKTEGRYIHYLPNTFDNEEQNNTQFQHFINVSHLIDNTINRGNIAKLMAIPEHSYEDNRPSFLDLLEDETNVDLYGKHHTFGAHNTITVQLAVEDAFSLVPTSSFRGKTNRSKSSTFQVLELETILPTFDADTPNTIYTYLRTNTDPFPNLRAVRHRKFSEVIFGAADTTVFNGHAFITKLDITNVSAVIAPSGDVLGVEYEYLRDLYTESYEQLDRRHAGTTTCDYFVSDDVAQSGVEVYQRVAAGGVYELTTLPYNSVNGVILSRVVQQVTDAYTESWQIRAGVCSEYYGYNKDYSPISVIDLPALAYSYDFCSACLGHYPVTITYSEVAADEDINDSWRVNKALNTATVPADKGDIVRMDYYNSRLVIRTETGCFLLSPNPQQIQLTDTTAFLGTGSFLSIPAQELDGSDSGYGGQQSVLGSVITPAGLFWCDEVSGKVFRYTDTIAEISRNGNYHFYERNLTKPLNYNYGLNGAVMYYDPKFEMVYVSSREYDDRQREYPGTISYAFTMSFDVKENVWRSFHSFIPAYGFHLARVMYTTPGQNIYAHNDYNRFSNFYGEQYDVAAQYTFTEGQTVRWKSAHYYATVMQYDETSKQWVHNRDQTFDQAIAFTNLQSSGLVDLRLTRNPYEQAQWSTQAKNVIEADQNYRIGSLRDISVDHPVITSQWAAIESYYNDRQGYIDHVPLNINRELPMHEQLYIRDKYVHLRLFFKDVNQRILVYYVTIRNLPTLR